MFSEFKHFPVLREELIDSLNIREGSTVVDCTAGLGGHIAEILSRIKNIRIIAIDKDEDVIPILMDKFEQNKNVKVINADYQDIDNVLSFFDIEKVDAVYADLGFSSLQIDKAERGFSFKDAPLDMRFSKKQELTAKDLLDNISYEDLKKILRDYGDENLATPIAKKIIKERDLGNLNTTRDLKKLVNAVYFGKGKKRGKIDPATKTFQAIRIAVNKEFETIINLVNKVEKVLKKGGRFSVISFHSGEDRLIKKAFNNKVNPCICPPDFPICTCKKIATFKWLNKTPVIPSEEEIKMNPRSRSAKLRVLERI